MKDGSSEFEVSQEEFARLRFIEEWGMFFELAGLQRMVGRVWAFLLVSDASQVSAAELADGLQASAGSISGATRYMQTIGLVRRVRRTGERRDLFELAPGGISRISSQRLTSLGSATALAQRGVDAFGDHPAVRARLEEIRDFYDWMVRELPPLFERWQDERDAAAKAVKS
jgi:hypothetical protein